MRFTIKCGVCGANENFHSEDLFVESARNHPKGHGSKVTLKDNHMTPEQMQAYQKKVMEKIQK